MRFKNGIYRNHLGHWNHCIHQIRTNCLSRSTVPIDKEREREKKRMSVMIDDNIHKVKFVVCVFYYSYHGRSSSWWFFLVNFNPRRSCNGKLKQIIESNLSIIPTE